MTKCAQSPWKKYNFSEMWFCYSQTHKKLRQTKGTTLLENLMNRFFACLNGFYFAGFSVSKTKYGEKISEDFFDVL